MTPEERAAWLAERRTGIGGSDIAKILNISPFGTSFQLWLEKTGRHEDEIRNAGRIEWGNRLEPVILDYWQDTHGKTLVRGKRVRHPQHAIVRATLDGCTDDGVAVVEVKNVDMTPKTPQPYYQCQVLWEMLASGASEGYLLELVRGHDPVEFRFDAADPDVVEHTKTMLDLALAWWDAHVVHDNPPDPLARDVALVQRLFPAVDVDASVDLPDELVSDYLAAKEDETAASMRKDLAQTKIQMLMGSAKHGRSGMGKVSWYSVSGRETIDLSAVKKHHPDAAKLIKVGNPYRAFKLT
jgi:putative phage-type endonuclease